VGAEGITGGAAADNGPAGCAHYPRRGAHPWVGGSPGAILLVMSSRPAMSSRPTPAIAERPTPNLGSAVVMNDRPDEVGDDPFVAYFLRMTPDEDAYLAARSAAADEGRRLYGDESSDAWLAALERGTHPLCRVPEPPRR
jgi:hypothetical protein